MFSKCDFKLFSLVVICFAMIGVAGCKEKSGEGVKSETAAMTPAMIKSLPTVILTGTKIQENADRSAVRVEITASGVFGSNVVPKKDPERIVVIVHNATKGNAPPDITVNNGTITHVNIDELNTGKGTAVRITIGLDHKSEYVVTPAGNGLLIDLRKRT